MVFLPKIMYKVKITTGKNSDGLLAQTPGSKGISKCGKYQFFIDEEVEDPDFWIVRNKYIKSKTASFVAPQNVILMISEPVSIVSFPKAYLKQFGLICSCQEEIRDIENVVYTPATLPWLVGVTTQNGVPKHSISYDYLKQSAPPKKTKLISVITSNKAFTRGHQERIEFVRKLKLHYGSKLDVYGRGINDFNDKWETLAPYKYHIALENSSSKYYWTEKISDCFLAGTFPIYYGCTNINDYFPEKSFETIKIGDFDKAVETIDKIIKDERFENSQQELLQSKDLVLEEYNMFDMISKICDTLNPEQSKETVSLKPAITVLNRRNFYHYFIERNYLNLRNAVRRLNKKNRI